MNSVRPSVDQLPRAGDVVAGKYRIESVIGSGGMGVVLGAQDISLGRRVAIKFLAPGKAQDDSNARFLREARAAASIQSEHVVRVFEVGTLPNGASYIVMEHLAGGDLGQHLAARGALPIDEAIDYVLEACEAIGEAHKLGIVHRDLKPQNLFLTRTPDGASCVKVLDFGISKAIDEAAPNLTSTEAVMGTPLYMSPEQVRSLKNVDLRTDIWALGAILFELVTAAPIFEAPSTTALYAMIAMDPPTSLRTKCPAAPPELEAVIQRCLHKDPNGRYPDVAALADALAPFASERGRISAARVARVVRGGHGAPTDPAWAAAGGAFATTGVVASGSQSYLPPPAGSGHGIGITSTGSHASNPPPPGYNSNLPPGANAAPGYTGYVQHANSAQHGSTPGPWQNQTGAIGPGTIQQRRSSSALGAILGVVAGVLLLAIVAGGAFYFFVAKKGAGDEAQAQADAAVSSATPQAANTAATAATSVAAAPGAPGTPKKGAPPAPPAAGAQKDAGVSPGAAPPTSAAPPAPAAAASAEAERLARLKQNAQGRCSAQAVIFKGTDQTAAKTVKTMTCTSASSFSPNSGSSNCERANCRRACTILNDQSCLFQLDNAERGNPLPF